MKNDIQEIGLRILASETSFVINLGSDFVINQNELVGDEGFIQALYEMLMCFATETVDNSGISNLRIESYLQYDESVQKKIEDFSPNIILLHHVYNIY